MLLTSCQNFFFFTEAGTWHNTRRLLFILLYLSEIYFDADTRLRQEGLEKKLSGTGHMLAYHRALKCAGATLEETGIVI